VTVAGAPSSSPSGRPLQGRPQQGRPQRARRLVAAAAATVAFLPLAGCAAGIQAETSRERPTIDGVGSALGTLTLRNAYVGGPAQPNSSAPVLLSLFNNGTEPDRLVTISSPQARGSSVPPDITLPPGGQQLLYTANRAPRLTGLTVPITPAQIVTVVFTFERAGELRLDLPVAEVPQDVLTGGGAPAPLPSGSATPTVSGSPGAPASPGAASSPTPTPSTTPAPGVNVGSGASASPGG
jgi:copper(I)-binding protein